MLPSRARQLSVLGLVLLLRPYPASAQQPPPDYSLCAAGADDVNTACCPASGCSAGAPAVCKPGCSPVFLAFWMSDCR